MYAFSVSSNSGQLINEYATLLNTCGLQEYGFGRWAFKEPRVIKGAGKELRTVKKYGHPDLVIRNNPKIKGKVGLVIAKTAILPAS